MPIKVNGNGISQHSLTSFPAVISDNTKSNVSSYSILGNGNQNGTPTPDNPIQPEFAGVRTVNICPFAAAETKTNNGIAAASNGSGTYHVSGTATADSDIRFDIQSFFIPRAVNRGGGSGGNGTFSMFNSATYENTDVKLVFYYRGRKIDDWGLTVRNRTSDSYAIMGEKDCDAIGFTVKSGVTVDFTISPEFTNDGVLPNKFEPYGYKIPITCAGQTTPVYLGEIPTVRRIKKYELTGNEQWIMASVGKFYMSNISQDYQRAPDALTYFCSHFPVYPQTNAITNVPDNMLSFGSLSISQCVYCTYTGASTIEEFKAFLAAQYANGTPVTVWYLLETPETGIVNEPLAKIGDHADEILSTAEGAPQITLQTGSPNTIDFDIPLKPSAMSIGYYEKMRKDTSLIFIPTPATKSTANPTYAPVHTAYAKNGTALYHAKNWFGFKIDKENSDSTAAVIYTHSAVTMTPAHMNYTTGVFDYGSWANVWFVKDSYPVALNFDGTEAYRLDPNDYTKKIDGTDSDIQYVLQTEEPSDWATQWKQYYTKSGDEYTLNSQAEAPVWTTDTYYTLTCLSDTVNFMVAFPKVYFKRFEDTRYNYIEVCDKKLGDDWYAYAHINANGDEVDHIYLPMFKGVIKDSKLRSIPGAIPQGYTTASTEVNAAEALGARWQIWDHSSRELINDLLVLMSKSIDSQTSFGKGREYGYDASDTVTYGKLQTGTAIRKGAFFGASNFLTEVKAFGIESLWANRWERLQGLLLVNGVYKIKMTPPYNFTGTDFVTLANTPVPSNAGCISQLSTSQYGSLPASTSNGSYNAFYCDYFNANQTGTRVGLVGGDCGGGAYDGFRCVNVYGAASYSYRALGASPIYK